MLAIPGGKRGHVPMLTGAQARNGVERLQAAGEKGRRGAGVAQLGTYRVAWQAREDAEARRLVGDGDRVGAADEIEAGWQARHRRTVAPLAHGTTGAALCVLHRAARRDGHLLQATRWRRAAERRSATITSTKVTTSVIETVRYWNRFIAVSSSKPRPPAPTKPSTSELRMFSSSR